MTSHGLLTCGFHLSNPAARILYPNTDLLIPYSCMVSAMAPTVLPTKSQSPVGLPQHQCAPAASASCSRVPGQAFILCAALEPCEGAHDVSVLW